MAMAERFFAAVPCNVSELRYEDVRRFRTPGGFVQQHVLRRRARSGAAVDEQTRAP